MVEFDWRNVKINCGYWKEKEELNRKVTINAVYDRFYDTGRIDAFACNWREGNENKPHIFWDSDVAKWIEGAAYILYRERDAELESKVENIIDLIEKNMKPEGYFNIYFTAVEPAARFTRRDEHELYCAGHLIEAAVAYFLATKKDRFLKLMCRYADYIYEVFVKEDSAAFRTCGHEEIELALYRLYRCTNNDKYLKLAEFFLNQRGNNSKDKYNTVCPHPVYEQDYAPVYEQDYAAGHAVRAMYLYCAMADDAYQSGDENKKHACEKLFEDVTQKKMYITGALGQTRRGEAFTKEYDLPSDTAYAETCASIGLMMFANRMLKLNKHAKYADCVERAMYNGMLSGISLDGKAFFYENPLEINLKKRKRFYCEKDFDMYSITQRVEVFECSCCPPNLNRVLSSMGNYIYGEENGCVYVHQYISSVAEKQNIKLEMKTNFPNDGKIVINATGAEKIALRIPGWCKNFELNRPYEIKDGYAYIDACDGEILLNLEIKPFLVGANPLVYDLSGKAALQMGPIVYCMESIDNKEELCAYYIDKNLNATYEKCDKCGLNVIEADGFYAASDTLYSGLDYDFSKTKMKFIPFAAASNRGECDKLVWINYR